MAYSTSNVPALVSQRVGADGGAIWIYKDGDTLDTVLGADYISNGDALGMKAGDKVIYIGDDNSNAELSVSSVTADGAATLVGPSTKLTVSGAIAPGAQGVELNHASTIIAATVADAKAHHGLFAIVNTSASGTAAHTVTLTSGTFDGTNTIATLNAPLEALFVWFDSAGNGTIVENVGTVALS
jgi:hypothetical protein